MREQMRTEVENRHIASLKTSLENPETYGVNGNNLVIYVGVCRVRMHEPWWQEDSTKWNHISYVSLLSDIFNYRYFLYQLWIFDQSDFF